MPAPTELKATVAVPLLAPAVPAAKPTLKVLLAPPWAKLTNEPEAATPPVLPLKLAAKPSWKPAGAALVLLMFNKPVAPAVARTLPRFKTVDKKLGCAT